MGPAPTAPRHFLSNRRSFPDLCRLRQEPGRCRGTTLSLTRLVRLGPWPRGCPFFCNQEGRRKAGGFVLARRLRRRLSDGCAGCLLVLPSFRSSGRKPGCLVLCRASAQCCFPLGGSVVGAPHWAGEHDGLDSPAFQFVPDRCRFRAFIESGSATVPMPRGARRDGCSNTPILRRSSGIAERADICQRHHESGAERFLGYRFVRGGLFHAERGILCPLGDRGWSEGKLRPAPLSCLSERETTGGALGS